MSNFMSLVKKARERDSYWETTAKTEVANEILCLLQDGGLTQAALADLMSVKPSYVSRVLSGAENLSIKTLVKFARVLGKRVTINFVDAAESTKTKPSSGHRCEWEVLVNTLERERHASPTSAVDPDTWSANASNEPFYFKDAANKDLCVA